MMPLQVVAVKGHAKSWLEIAIYNPDPLALDRAISARIAID